MTTSILMGGAAGRMGQAILALAAEDNDFTVAGGLEFEGSPAVGKTVGEIIGMPSIDAPVVDDAEQIPTDDKPVAIHFSSPEATLEQIEWSRKNGLPVVIGTTGLDAEQVKQLKTVAQDIPIVYAPNMSVGVNVLFKLVGMVTEILGEDYDVEVTEMHHRFKKDAPSGTARRLAEVAADAMGGDYDDLVVDGRSGMTGERPSRQIGMHALRGGDVVGDHTVTFATQGERVELTHKASSRDTFAKGALRAAAWLQGKQPGLYDMQDVLGLR